MISEDREQWAEDHGYWHGVCKQHGSFWTDSTRCPYCPDDDALVDALDADEDD
jgi:hypothetical protein